MKDAECPDESELFAFIDEPDPTSPLAAHIASCAACGRERRQLEGLLDGLREPARDYPADKLVSQLGAAIAKDERAAATRSQHRRFKLIGAGFTALAVAAMMTLAPGFLRREREGESFVPRGVNAEAGALRDVALALDVVTRSAGGAIALTPASATSATNLRSHLLVSYATRSARSAFHLLCFGVDAKGEVHWLYPVFEDAATDPASVVLPPGRADTPLDSEAALDEVPPGRLRVFAMVSPHALHVSDVEHLPLGELETEKLAVRFGVDVRSWELRIEQRDGAAP